MEQETFLELDLTAELKNLENFLHLLYESEMLNKESKDLEDEDEGEGIKTEKPKRANKAYIKTDKEEKSKHFYFEVEYDEDYNTIFTKTEDDYILSSGHSETEKTDYTFSELKFNLKEFENNETHEKNLQSSFESDGTSSYSNKVVMKVKYNDPIFMNNQWTYQRIFIENQEEGLTVYDLTVKESRSGNLEVRTKHDHEFKTEYFSSINGVENEPNSYGPKSKSNEHGAFWEAFVNNQIIEGPLDEKKLKKGDVVEWRLANEREESGCGGGGDDTFLRKSELYERKIATGKYNMNTRNPFNSPFTRPLGLSYNNQSNYVLT